MHVMSDEKDHALKSIFRAGVLVFLGTVFSKFAGLAYRVLVGRYLGPADYGVISVMIAVFSVATTIAFVGIPNGVQKYVAYYRGKEDHSRVLGAARTGLILLTIPSVIVAVLLFALAPWLAEAVFHEPLAIWPIRMVAVIIPLRGWTQILTCITTAYEQMRYEVYVGRIAVNVIKLTVAVPLVALGYGYLGAAFAYAFSFGVIVLLAAYYARKVVPDLFDLSVPDERNYSEMISHSWPLLAAGLVGAITGHVDTFMLQSFLGSAEVGKYQAAYPFGMLLTAVGGIFATMFLSNVSKLEALEMEAEIAETYRTVVKWIAIGVVPLFLIMFAFPRAVLVVFGDQYYGVTNVLRVLALGFLASTLIGPVGRMYQAMSRTRLNFYTTLVAATGNLTLNYLLIPMDAWYGGLMGAAIATSLTFVFVEITHLVFIRWLLGIQPFRLAVGKVWFAGAAAITVAWAGANLVFDVTPAWALPLILVVFGLVYAVVLLVIGTIEEDDLVILRAVREKIGVEMEWLERLVKRFS